MNELTIENGDSISKLQPHYATQMAGEFYAAGELFRQGYFANGSFGNAKSFDIVVFSNREDKFARIEIKTSKGEYYTRNKLPSRDNEQKFHFNIEAKRRIENCKKRF